MIDRESSGHRQTTLFVSRKRVIHDFMIVLPLVSYTLAILQDKNSPQKIIPQFYVALLIALISNNRYFS